MKPYKNASELPIWNYWQVINTGEVEYLIESGKLSDDKKQRQKDLAELAKIWDGIEVELYDIFVKDPDYITSLIEEKQYLYRIINAAIEPNAYNNLLKEVAENEKNKESEPFDYEGSLAVLEKYLGFTINDKQMSVKRYYTHLRLMKANNRPSN